MNNAFSKKSVFCNTLDNQKNFRQLAEENTSYLLSITIDMFKNKVLAEKVVNNIFTSTRETSHWLMNIQNLKACFTHFLKNSCIGLLKCNPFYISIDSLKKFLYSKNLICNVEFWDVELRKIKYQLDCCPGGTMNNKIVKGQK